MSRYLQTLLYCHLLYFSVPICSSMQFCSAEATSAKHFAITLENMLGTTLWITEFNASQKIYFRKNILTLPTNNQGHTVKMDRTRGTQGCFTLSSVESLNKLLYWFLPISGKYIASNWFTHSYGLHWMRVFTEWDICVCTGSLGRCNQ